MEKFNFFHHKDYKVRNRCEQAVLEFSKNLVSNPLEMNIEEVFNEINQFLKEYNLENPRHGSVDVSKLRISGTICGKPHFVTRQFSVTAIGRKISTFSIYESLFKDSSQNYRKVKSKLNGDSENE